MLLHPVAVWLHLVTVDKGQSIIKLNLLLLRTSEIWSDEASLTMNEWIKSCGFVMFSLIDTGTQRQIRRIDKQSQILFLYRRRMLPSLPLSPSYPLHGLDLGLLKGSETDITSFFFSLPKKCKTRATRHNWAFSSRWRRPSHSSVCNVHVYFWIGFSVSCWQSTEAEHGGDMKAVIGLLLMVLNVCHGESFNVQHQKYE